jgi:hypothetical protein
VKIEEAHFHDDVGVEQVARVGSMMLGSAGVTV